MSETTYEKKLLVSIRVSGARKDLGWLTERFLQKMLEGEALDDDPSQCGRPDAYTIKVTVDEHECPKLAAGPVDAAFKRIDKLEERLAGLVEQLVVGIVDTARAHNHPGPTSAYRPGGHIFDEKGRCACGHTTKDDPIRCPLTVLKVDGQPDATLALQQKCEEAIAPSRLYSCNSTNPHCKTNDPARCWAMKKWPEASRKMDHPAGNSRCAGCIRRPTLEQEMAVAIDKAEKVMGSPWDGSLVTVPWADPDSPYKNNGPSEVRVEFSVAGVFFAVEHARETGFDTGRMRYLVRCLDCDRDVHPGTTGPRHVISQHLWERHGWRACCR